MGLAALLSLSALAGCGDDGDGSRDALADNEAVTTSLASTDHTTTRVPATTTTMEPTTTTGPTTSSPAPQDTVQGEVVELEVGDSAIWEVEGTTDEATFAILGAQVAKESECGVTTATAAEGSELWVLDASFTNGSSLGSLGSGLNYFAVTKDGQELKEVNRNGCGWLFVPVRGTETKGLVFEGPEGEAEIVFEWNPRGDDTARWRIARP